MKKKICLYVDGRGSQEHRVTEFSEWMTNDDDYIISSEVVEFDFSLLPAEKVVPRQLASIEAKRTEETERHAQTIAMLDERKGKLLAITHEG